MTTTFKGSSLILVVIAAAVLMLVFVNAVPKTKDLYKPHETPCNVFRPEQDDVILSVGKRLLPGGDLREYPLFADRVTRLSYLAKLGVTDTTEATSLHMDIALVYQTLREMKAGHCWHSDNNLVMVMLEELKKHL